MVRHAMAIKGEVGFRVQTPLCVALVLAFSCLVQCADPVSWKLGTALASGLPTAVVPRDAQLEEAPSRRLVSTVSAEACLKENIYTVLYSCPGYNGSRSSPSASGVEGTQNMRDAMVKLLQSCVLGSTTSSSPTQAMRMLLPGGFIAQLVSNLTSVYTRTTGIPIQMAIPPVSTYTQVRLSSIQNPSNQSLTHEVWLVTPSAIGDGVRAGAFMDLSDLVLYDQRLQWQGLIPQMRSVGLVYNSKVVSLPLSTYSLQLFYRMDTFAANNWTVPRTWRQMADQAVRMNGTSNMWGFCGSWGPCGQLGTNLIKYILASYHQTQGATQGWLLEPDSMRLMLDSPALPEAMDILKVLYQLSPPDQSAQTGCAAGTGPMFNDSCHMAIYWGNTFKFASHIANARRVGGLQGNLGVAFAPGSDRVLDRATNTLMPCDATRCPHATRSTNARVNVGLSSEWVNKSPGFEAVLMPVNAQASASLGFYAFSVASYLSRPEISDQMVFNPLAETMPTRTSQVQPAKWQAAGYNLEDATRYCSAHAAAMSHPNLHVQIRIPGASSFLVLFGSLMASVMQGNVSTPDIAASAQARGWAILNTTFRGNLTELKSEYWRSINKRMPPPQWPPPPSSVPQQPYEEPPAEATQTRFQDLMIILSVVLPTLAVLILLYIAIRSRWIDKLSSRSTWRKPPGVGPRTTLLVSDIENSTTLWEEVDAAVMDASAKLHNACLRTLAVKHKGYESVWEGDSFIIAFGDPVDALKFSLAAQQDLLHLDWPSRLLAHPAAAVVWVQRNRAPVGGTEVSQKGSLIRTPAHQQGPPSCHTTHHPKHTPRQTPAQAGAPTCPDPGSWDTGFYPGYTSSPAATMFSSSNKSRPSPNGGSRTQEACTDEPVVTMSPSSAADMARLMGPPAGDWVIPTAGNSPVLHRAYPTSTDRSSGGNGLAALSTAAEGITAHASTWTLRKSFQAKWTRKAEGSNSTADATLAYRGLRVRLGFHAGGLTSSADLRFNDASRRWVYTGIVRVAANAVASAGLGGHILMSSATAGLLGRDTNGVLRLLPSSCHVYHMGDHVLQGMPAEQPVGLLLVLPKSLKCRLALEQADLRTMQCMGLGILGAPGIAPDHVRGASRAPVLVGLQVSGLSALMAWNRQETQQAVGQLVGILEQQLRLWRGLLSEDGLSAGADASSGPAAPDMALAAPSKDSTVPGRVVAAFFNADDALRWALIVRHCLLLHDWSDELMSHEMCEQVGLMPAQTMGPIQAVFQEVRAVDAANRGPHASSSLLRLSHRGTAISRLNHAASRLSMSVRLPEPASARRSGAVGSSSFTQSIASAVTVTPSPNHHHHNRRLIPSSDGADPWPETSKADADVLVPAAAPLTTRKGSSITTNPVGQRHAAPSLELAPDAPFGSSNNPGSNRQGVVFPLASAPSGKHNSGSRDQPAANAVFASDAPMLCGLRVRLAVTSGPAAVHIATRSSGRAVYRGGKGVKQLNKLLQQARAGQVLVAGNVMQDAEHDLE